LRGVISPFGTSMQEFFGSFQFAPGLAGHDRGQAGIFSARMSMRAIYGSEKRTPVLGPSWIVNHEIVLDSSTRSTAPG